MLEMGKTQKTRIASYALIMHEDKVLLCRISKEIPIFEGQWTLPGGGIDFGEKPQNAMIREVFEETGLKVKSSKIIDVDSIIITNDQEDFHSVRIIYSAITESYDTRPEINGTTDLAKWHYLRDCDDLRLVDLAKTGISLLKEQHAKSIN